MSRINSNPPSGPNESYANSGTKTAGGLNVIAGIWLIIAGFVLGYAHEPTALWNSIILGIIVLVIAWIRMANVATMPGLAWVNMLAGIWLVISPWVLHFANQQTPTWNSVVLGIIVFILAAWGLASSPQRPALG